VGYEKLFNPAMQFADEQRFVAYVLADQPETPTYFAVAKRANKVGPPLIRELPPVAPLNLSMMAATARESVVIDTIASSEFSTGHVPGTINVPAAMLVQWAGYFVNYDMPVSLITDADSLPSILRSLRAIGIDRVGGYFDASQVRQAGLRSESYPMAPPEELYEPIAAGHVTLIDVRASAEFHAGHIAQAEHHFLGALPKEFAHLDRRKPIVAQCQSGARSAVASSILQRAGFSVTNLRGGYRAWVQAGLPVMRDSSAK
jgi:hydroxyacylglutathione hydrolase